MIRAVDFVNQATAEGLPGQPMQDTVAMISIATPGGWEPMLANFAHLLRLEFDDVEAPEEPGVVFGDEDAKQVIEFVARLHSQADAWDVIVHCQAGISRSAAVALYVAEASRCAFPRRAEAYAANLLVLQVLAEGTGIKLGRPERGVP